MSAPSATPLLVSDCGTTVDVDIVRYCAEPSDAEQQMLQRVTGPVIDIGCGPGRAAAFLRRLGVPAVGLEISTELARRARSNGALCVHQSVFDPVPFEGRWHEALLLDGNIGIGGDPRKLLDRVRRIVRPFGRALVEIDGPHVRTQQLIVREHHRGVIGTPFPWARVSVDGIKDLIENSGWRLDDVHTLRNRNSEDGSGDRPSRRLVAVLERMP